MSDFSGSWPRGLGVEETAAVTADIFTDGHVFRSDISGICRVMFKRWEGLYKAVRYEAFMARLTRFAVITDRPEDMVGIVETSEDLRNTAWMVRAGDLRDELSGDAPLSRTEKVTNILRRKFLLDGGVAGKEQLAEAYVMPLRAARTAGDNNEPLDETVGL